MVGLQRSAAIFVGARALKESGKVATDLSKEMKHRVLLELNSQIDEMQVSINWLIWCTEEKKGVGLASRVGYGLREDNKRGGSGGFFSLGRTQSKGPQLVNLVNIGHLGEANLKRKKKVVGLGLCESPRKIWREKGPKSRVSSMLDLPNTSSLEPNLVQKGVLV